jgi:hypothetical protein
VCFCCIIRGLLVSQTRTSTPLWSSKSRNFIKNKKIYKMDELGVKLTGPVSISTLVNQRSPDYTTETHGPLLAGTASKKPQPNDLNWLDKNRLNLPVTYVVVCFYKHTTSLGVMIIVRSMVRINEALIHYGLYFFAKYNVYSKKQMRK